MVLCTCASALHASPILDLANRLTLLPGSSPSLLIRPALFEGVSITDLCWSGTGKTMYLFFWRLSSGYLVLDIYLAWLWLAPRLEVVNCLDFRSFAELLKALEGDRGWELILSGPPAATGSLRREGCAPHHSTAAVGTRPASTVSRIFHVPPAPHLPQLSPALPRILLALHSSGTMATSTQSHTRQGAIQHTE